MLIKLYEDNPNHRDINKIADALSQGRIVIIPTDTLYAFACSIDYKEAAEKIAQLKNFSLKKARYSLLFDSISSASEYVRPMDKELYSLVRQCLPGPFTFIMDANNNVPRRYLNPNKTIGIRVPQNNICRAIIEAVGTPLICTSVRTLDKEVEQEYYTDPELIHDTFGHQVHIVVDGGIGNTDPSTVVDCSGGNISLMRQGKGQLPVEL